MFSHLDRADEKVNIVYEFDFEIEENIEED